jgi:sulfite dehydrogenase (quinone) subunit SoeA
MIGRPVAIHAMRGISAHSNGFQTARALHLLQILLGARSRRPAASASSRPTPSPRPRIPAAPQGVPGQPLDGPHLGYPHGPDDLALREDGTPARIDKAFTWETRCRRMA